MTIIALVLNVLLGIISLAIGYSQAGIIGYSLWFFLLAVAWFVTHFRRWYWFSSVALLIMVFAAAYGVWREAPVVWMLLGGSVPSLPGISLILLVD